jgi:hypothetical protein
MLVCSARGGAGFFFNPTLTPLHAATSLHPTALVAHPAPAVPPTAMTAQKGKLSVHLSGLPQMGEEAYEFLCAVYE